MKGTLYKNNNAWWVKHTYGDVKLIQEDVTGKLEEGQEIVFLYEKKYLDKETLWFAKIIPPQPTWDSIIERYGQATGVPEDALDFWIWLKENYYPPKNK